MKKLKSRKFAEITAHLKEEHNIATFSFTRALVDELDS